MYVMKTFCYQDYLKKVFFSCFECCFQMTADDEEKANAAKKQKERAHKRLFKRGVPGESGGDLNDSGAYEEDPEDSLLDVADKRVRMGDGVSDALSHRLVTELQTAKSITRIGAEFLTQESVDTAEALALVQQQLASCQAVLSTAQAVLIRIVAAKDAKK